MDVFICRGAEILTPSASDPLVQRTCRFCVYDWPHMDENKEWQIYSACPEYNPQLLDFMEAAEVLREPGSRAFNLMWGIADE